MISLKTQPLSPPFGGRGCLSRFVSLPNEHLTIERPGN